VRARSTLLVLTRRDIERLLTMRQAIRVAAQAFRAYTQGEARMPPKLYLDLPEFAGDFRAMPAYLAHPPAAGLKWVNVHARNPRRGLPTVMAVVLLNDPTTGRPLAILDGTSITRFRTGAAGGLAAQWLARRESSVVGLVGCGQQAEVQLAALLVTHRLTTVRVWGLRLAEAKRFVHRASSLVHRGMRLHPVSSITQCVRDADIIVTTTPSRQPLVYAKWLKPGVHINAIGADAPGKRELAWDVLCDARIVVDDWTQAAHGGEINVPVRQGKLTRRHIAATLGEVLIGRHPGRRNPHERTVFDSTGLAIQDIALASWLYRKAQVRHLGQRVALT